MIGTAKNVVPILVKVTAPNIKDELKKEYSRVGKMTILGIYSQSLLFNYIISVAKKINSKETISGFLKYWDSL